MISLLAFLFLALIVSLVVHAWSNGIEEMSKLTPEELEAERKKWLNCGNPEQMLKSRRGDAGKWYTAIALCFLAVSAHADNSYIDSRMAYMDFGGGSACLTECLMVRDTRWYDRLLVDEFIPVVGTFIEQKGEGRSSVNTWSEIGMAALGAAGVRLTVHFAAGGCK